jgi:3-phytase
MALAASACQGAVEEPASRRTPQRTVQPTESPSPPAKDRSKTVPKYDGPVTAVVETDPVPGEDDAADDPAIWIHPSDPSKSVVIGTDKEGSGLGVYALDGSELQFVREDGRINNVDVRDFKFEGEKVPLVVASDRARHALRVYVLNTDTRRLRDVGFIEVGIDAYGVCLYRSRAGDLYAFPNSEGVVEQWELGAYAGRVAGSKVREWDLGGATEGCAADDELGFLYVGEEEGGIWKYGADPNDPTSNPEQVDTTDDGGHLDADVEGLALIKQPRGKGYLVASSQGDDSFAIYERTGGNDYVESFKVVEGEIDGCSHTDGIDITSEDVDKRFPYGFFVCQDDENPGAHQNFKLVPLERILP